MYVSDLFNREAWISDVFFIFQMSDLFSRDLSEVSEVASQAPLEKLTAYSAVAQIARSGSDCSGLLRIAQLSRVLGFGVKNQEIL